MSAPRLVSLQMDKPRRHHLQVSAGGVGAGQGLFPLPQPGACRAVLRASLSSSRAGGDAVPAAPLQKQPHSLLAAVVTPGCAQAALGPKCGCLWDGTWALSQGHLKMQLLLGWDTACSMRQEPGPSCREGTVSDVLTTPCPPGCLASWPRSRAAPVRTCATSSPSWTPSSRPPPLSTSSPRSCWACTGSEGPPPGAPRTPGSSFWSTSRPLDSRLPLPPLLEGAEWGRGLQSQA